SQDSLLLSDMSSEEPESSHDETSDEADDELSDSDSTKEAPPMAHSITVKRIVRKAISAAYSTRYQAPRNRDMRGPPYVPHVLKVLKHRRPDKFRRYLRVSPYTFDRLVETIGNDLIFTNKSQNCQLPIDLQLAITLHRFGHDGNGVSVQGVAGWGGIAVGTVLLVTRRVMTALLRPAFMQDAVSLPSQEEKEQAKAWVEKHSCRAWRDGWLISTSLMVDGTLVSLYTCPKWYSESYFDRKSNYFLNIQVVSLLNLRIVDFAYGHTGSTHDATAWEQTRIYQEHDALLEGQEFVWADSAYPIASWVVAPYKK
ncbi:uncharacterized protein PHACADRAFT_63878, partial [Phanerochaete carnosa HHB-10118-sp]